MRRYSQVRPTTLGSPNHLAAASKLFTGNRVADIFEVCAFKLGVSDANEQSTRKRHEPLSD